MLKKACSGSEVSQNIESISNLQSANNICADQTARMRRLVCAFVVRNPQDRVFSRRDPFNL